MNNKNFKNETFTTLPSLIMASNFESCVFKVESRFERCNLRNCEFEQPCYFDRSNVINCTGEALDNSTYDKSSRHTEDADRESRRRLREEEREEIKEIEE